MFRRRWNVAPDKERFHGIWSANVIRIERKSSTFRDLIPCHGTEISATLERISAIWNARSGFRLRSILAGVTDCVTTLEIRSADYTDVEWNPFLAGRQRRLASLGLISENSRPVLKARCMWNDSQPLATQ